MTDTIMAKTLDSEIQITYVHWQVQPSLSFITNKAAASPDCATFALAMKEQSPRVDKAIEPESCKKNHLLALGFITMTLTNNTMLYPSFPKISIQISSFSWSSYKVQKAYCVIFFEDN